MLACFRSAASLTTCFACLSLTLAGCSEANSPPDEISAEEFIAGQPVEERLVAGESYDDFDKRRDASEGGYGTFEGYGCTVDCSGHEAGYAWAEEKGITDPDHCGGKSWSFIEGCRAYAAQTFAGWD